MDITPDSKLTTLEKNKLTFLLDILQYSTLAFSGGLIGAYSIEMCDHIYANAQTSNLINLALTIKTHNPVNLLLHVMVLALYFFGISLTILLPEYLKRYSIRFESVCLLIESVCIGSLLFIPINIAPVLYIAPAFFAAALQYNTFKSCHTVGVSTLFCTNNLRQLIISFWNYRNTKDSFELLKMKVYTIVILSFTAGAFCCFYVIDAFQKFTVLIAFFILLGNYFMLTKSVRIIGLHMINEIKKLSRIAYEA